MRVARIGFPVVGALVAAVAVAVAGPSRTGDIPAASPSPVATATPSPSPVPQRRAIVIQATGDVSLDPSYIPAFRDRGYGWAWSGLGGAFRDDDLTIVNLECPATSVVAPLEKEFVFRCDPAALPAMRRAGVEIANQANNHALDQGVDGLLDSLANLRAAGLTPVGAGVDEASAIAPAVVDVGGWKIAIVGLGQVLDPLWQVAGPDTPGTAAGHDVEEMLRGIRAADAVADLVVVVIHWGVELDTEPRSWQVEQAVRMVAAGADVIFGHHAHRLQPLETVEGRPVFYGLGNFVWPRLSAAGSWTAIGRVLVAPDGTLTASLVPVTIVSSGRPVPDGAVW
jgi:poly-gamma-glutamate capsule biosynthesis protein CapA/YwtB (metallophosphatase superfamily)